MNSTANARWCRSLVAAVLATSIGAGSSGCAMLRPENPAPAPVVELKPVSVAPVPMELLVPVAKTECLPKGVKKISVPQFEKAYSCKDGAESSVIAKHDTLQRAVITRESAQHELAQK